MTYWEPAYFENIAPFPAGMKYLLKHIEITNSLQENPISRKNPAQNFLNPIQTHPKDKPLQMKLYQKRKKSSRNGGTYVVTIFHFVFKILKPHLFHHDRVVSRLYHICGERVSKWKWELLTDQPCAYWFNMCVWCYDVHCTYIYLYLPEIGSANLYITLPSDSIASPYFCAASWQEILNYTRSCGIFQISWTFHVKRRHAHSWIS